MKFKISAVTVCILIGIFIPCWTLALSLDDFKPVYAGVSLHYAQEIEWIFNNSDYVDYESRQLRLFAGNNFTDSWHLEYELVVADVREERDGWHKNETLYGFQVGILYDFLRFKHMSS